MNAAQSVGGLAADKVGAVKTAAIASLPQQGVPLSRSRRDGRRLDPSPGSFSARSACS